MNDILYCHSIVRSIQIKHTMRNVSLTMTIDYIYLSQAVYKGSMSILTEIARTFHTNYIQIDIYFTLL